MTRTLDRVLYKKSNKTYKGVVSEQDVELKVASNNLQFSTDGINWVGTGEKREVANINLDTDADGVYILTDENSSITYGETSGSGSYKMAVVQKAFFTGLGTFVRVYLSDGRIEVYTKSNIAGSSWQKTTYNTRGLLPSGGTQGQVLTKVDGTDYNTTWANASGGSLYLHLIRLSHNATESYINIISTNNNAYTTSTLAQYLYSMQTQTAGICVTGGNYSNTFGNLTFPYKVNSTNGTDLTLSICQFNLTINNNNISVTRNLTSIGCTVLTDKVFQIS